MSNADAVRAEAARSAARARWGDQVAVRAAQTVIERAAELPLTVRAQVHLATADQEDGDE
jgi:hypothetical protein